MPAELPEPARKLKQKYQSTTRLRASVRWATKQTLRGPGVFLRGSVRGDLYGRTANVPNTLC